MYIGNIAAPTVYVASVSYEPNLGKSLGISFSAALRISNSHKYHGKDGILNTALYLIIISEGKQLVITFSMNYICMTINLFKRLLLDIKDSQN